MAQNSSLVIDLFELHAYVKAMLTQARLQEVLHYDPLTGIFRWREGVTGGKHGGNQRAGHRAGSINADGARQINVDKRIYMASHLAFLYMTGRKPKEVDHKNRCPDDNTWTNLREATRSQNCVNRHGRRSKNHDLPRGVYRVGSTIIAQIVREQKRTYLGSFKTIEEAKAAYDAAAAQDRLSYEFLPSSEQPVEEVSSGASVQEDSPTQA